MLLAISLSALLSRASLLVLALVLRSSTSDGELDRSFISLDIDRLFGNVSLLHGGGRGGGDVALFRELRGCRRSAVSYDR